MPIFLPKYCRASHIGDAPKVVGVALNVARLLCCCCCCCCCCCVVVGWLVGLGWFGLVWVGLGWFGLVWVGLGWFGLVGLVWFGLVWLVGWLVQTKTEALKTSYPSLFWNLLGVP